MDGMVNNNNNIHRYTDKKKQNLTYKMYNFELIYEFSFFDSIPLLIERFTRIYSCPFELHSF